MYIKFNVDPVIILGSTSHGLYDLSWTYINVDQY
jgi:hypothetical protein